MSDFDVGQFDVNHFIDLLNSGTANNEDYKNLFNSKAKRTKKDLLIRANGRDNFAVHGGFGYSLCNSEDFAHIPCPQAHNTVVVELDLPAINVRYLSPKAKVGGLGAFGEAKDTADMDKLKDIRDVIDAVNQIANKIVVDTHETDTVQAPVVNIIEEEDEDSFTTLVNEIYESACLAAMDPNAPEVKVSQVISKVNSYLKANGITIEPIKIDRRSKEDGDSEWLLKALQKVETHLERALNSAESHAIQRMQKTLNKLREVIYREIQKAELKEEVVKEGLKGTRQKEEATKRVGTTRVTEVDPEGNVSVASFSGSDTHASGVHSMTKAASAP